MADPKEPYGDVSYADPGYQPDKKKRYPIDTAAHVKAAWSYISQKENAGRYTRPQLERIRSRIRAAAKKFGIELSDSGRSADNIEEGGGMAAAVERRYTLVPVELRMDGEKRRIGGYAAMFDRPSRNLGGFVETVERSFFNKSRGDGWPDVMARYNHDDNMLLGTTGAGTLSLRLDETGLDYLVDPPHSREDVVELVQRGDVRKSSFAFRVPSGGDEWTVSDQGYPLRKLVTGQLVDVAPVNAPAYLDTTAALRSLADKVSADPEEVRAAAEGNELVRFFQKTSSAPMPKPKPTTLGASAMVALMARREDPWG